MATKVLMPQFGESVNEATITKWLKHIGDRVEEFEPILEVNTDKVDTEIPSPTSGVLLATLVQEDTIVKSGTLLAWIGQPGESVETNLVSPLQAPPPEASVPAILEVENPASKLYLPGKDRQLGFVSPLVARIASQFHVDLSRVKGSGQGGRITKQDILAYIENRPEAGESRLEKTAIPVSQHSTSPASLPGELLPLNPVRRLIAEHMVTSKRTSPHVTTVMEADLSRVVAHRTANKDAYIRDGINLTFTAYFVSAAASALRAYPIVNSSWSEAGVRLHKQINIGMATSLGAEGLIVPVIKDADTLSLLGLARTINDLASRARLHKLQPDEVKGGTFTITNHGTSGSLFATPIINQPQCAILGVGAIQKRVIVTTDNLVGDALAIRPMLYLSLTFDHRVLDGAIADNYLAKVVESLQNWA
jgi:pyruvate/2-oxoglutarate dehydrogenase complex dihydrolipoamide acyltransferase (E2) component